MDDQRAAQRGAGRPQPGPENSGDDPLLLVFAHPDDETFGCAGTIHEATTQGLIVTLLTATRGEAGKTGDPRIDTPEILGAVREQELRAAMAAVGLTDVRFLDYRDSGMEGTAENDDPRALIRAREEDVVTRIVVQLRAIRPAIVITFGPDGIYGHPDHLFIHRAATAAVHAAADPEVLPAVAAPWQTPVLYYSTAPRERMVEMAARPDGPMRDVSPERLAMLGTPRAEITTVIDVSLHADVKQQAIAAHRTQTGDGGPMSDMPAERTEALLSREHFVRAPLPWRRANDDPHDWLARLAAAHPISPA